MFSVEALIREDALPSTMQAMRTWLDHVHFEPASFRYAFGRDGIRCRVDFSIADEAAAFAKAFDGKVIPTREEAAI